jgi:hypothetical protein
MMVSIEDECYTDPRGHRGFDRLNCLRPDASVSLCLLRAESTVESAVTG